MIWQTLARFFYPNQDTTSITEKALSGLASLGGIGLLMLVSGYFLAAEDLPWVVASMGASAVLLFAVPMGPLSQPWPFVGGHLISGVIGITIARLVPDVALADFLRQVMENDGRPLKERLWAFIKKTPGNTTDKPEYAGHIMTSAVVSVKENPHILDLFSIFHEQGLHHIPVVNGENQLRGMITPKNILAALHQDIGSVHSIDKL